MYTEPTEPGAGAPAPSVILVVEPDILARMVIADYLRECGYKIVEGTNADDVLTVLGVDRKIDIVLAAVELGGSIDGFALARRIRQEYPRIDVILTSSLAKVADEAGDLCEEGPAEKPYHPQDVVRRINQLREKRRTAPEPKG
ncbi:MAG TPA: response regulator [Aliidongia sp.]|nr:response regulator [Aliidongia sp.]